MPAPPALASSDAERRPLTVMFCDLADSTALSRQLDPEDLQDVIRARNGFIKEIALQVPLGAALLMTKGHSAPEVAAVYTRARELCRQVEVEDAGEFPVLFGLWRFYVTKPALQTTRELGEQLLRLAERFGEPPLHVVAH